MNSNSDNQSESSLPTQIVPTIRSSPPILWRHSPSPTMNNKLVVKSEPPLTQDAEASRPPLRRVSSDETERPPSAQQLLHRDVDEQTVARGDDEQEAEDIDPAEAIVDFDWNDLHERYHEAVNKCHGQETELMQEWENLMSVVLLSPSQLGDADTGLVFPHLGRVWA